MRITVKLLKQRGYTTGTGAVDYYKAQKDNGEIIYLQRFSYNDAFTPTEWSVCGRQTFEGDDSPIITINRDETIDL